MANPYFSFKRFTVYHDRCAMKVGTDGVLLGAWTDVARARRILDIGTGTGLIALMLAQRTESLSASILALDIDGDAVEQARENVARSPWAERVTVMQADVRGYGLEPGVEEGAEEGALSASSRFDLIVSNPPYFNALKCPDAQRHAARHTDSLSFRELAAAAERLLTGEGRFAVVIPTDAEPEFLAATAEVDLFPQRRLLVRTKVGAVAKRVLLEFGRRAVGEVTTTELLLEDAPGVRSEGYKALAGEFYLK